MPKPKRTRIYLNNSSGFCELMWVHNHKQNEILMGFSGLSGDQATLLWEYPEKVLAPGTRFDIDHSEGIKVDKIFDHISIHVDGRFHIKTSSENPIYHHKMKRMKPLDSTSPIFFEFCLWTDLAEKYPILQKPKNPSAFLRIQDGKSVGIKGLFSGIKHDLMKEVQTIFSTSQSAVVRNQAVIRLTSGTLQGALFQLTINDSIENLLPRPDGTFLVVYFPLPGGKILHKGFLFA